MLWVDCRVSVLDLPPMAPALLVPAWPSASTLAQSPCCPFPPLTQHTQDMRSASIICHHLSNVWL